MRRRHGDAVQIEFCDVDSAEARERWSEIISKADKEGWETPYADVDGRLTPLDALDTWVIIELVETALARRRATQGSN